MTSRERPNDWLEQRIAELEETVKRLEMHVQNTRTDVRFHDEALTTLYERTDTPRRIKERKAPYGT